MNVKISSKKVPTFSPDDIREIRHEHGWDQADLAQVLNISRAAIASWETGRKTPHGCAVRMLQLLKEHPKSVIDTVRGRSVAMPGGTLAEQLGL